MHTSFLFALFLAFGVVTSTSPADNFFVTFGASSESDRSSGLEIDETGIYVSGQTQTNGNDFDAFTMKLDFTGIAEYNVQHHLVGNSDFVLDSTQNADSIFTCGRTSINPSMQVSRISKSDGSEIWTKQYSVTGAGPTNSVMVDSSFVYFVFYDYLTSSLHIVKLNLNDGSEVYQVKYSTPGLFNLFGKIYDGYLYITFRDGSNLLNIWRVVPADGSLDWGKTETYSNVPRGLLVNPQGVFVFGGLNSNELYWVQFTHDGTARFTFTYSAPSMWVLSVGGDDNYIYVAYGCGSQGSSLGDYSTPTCVTKFDNSGNIMWGLKFTTVRDFDITNIASYGGFVYLLGYGDSFALLDYDDIFLLAINDDGTLPDYSCSGLISETFTDFSEITAYVPTETDLSTTGSTSTLSVASDSWVFESWSYTFNVEESCPEGNNIWALIEDGFKEISVVDGFLAPMWDFDSSNRLFTITSDGSTFSAEKEGKYFSCIRTGCKMSDSSDSYALETLSNDGQYTYALLKKGQRYISYQYGKFFLDNKKKGATVFKF